MTNGIFDSHAHYNDPAFSGDADEVLSSLFENGVSYIVNVGYNIGITKLARAQSAKYPNLYFAAGIHPEEALSLPVDYLSQLKELSLDPKCAAIGEIGLDYHRDEVSHELQKHIFGEQLELARSLKLPVIVHSRDAAQDTLDIIKAHGYHNGVVHCFSGSAQTAKALVDLGWYIGFTGVVTFKNAKKAVSAAEAVPADRLLVETDCPYMAPVPYRGKRCTSDMIYYTAEKLAEIKGMTVQELISITCDNAKRLYNIK